MAERKLKKRNSVAPLEDMGSIGLPSNPQVVVLSDGSQTHVLPPVPVIQDTPDAGIRTARLEELQRLMNQNPQLQSLYNGQIAIDQLNEMELRRLEHRFRSQLSSYGGDSSAHIAPTLPSPNPQQNIPPLQPAFGPDSALGAEGALAPQGILAPQGLLMSYGFLGPQGLLRPRADRPTQLQMTAPKSAASSDSLESLKAPRATSATPTTSGEPPSASPQQASPNHAQASWGFTSSDAHSQATSPAFQSSLSSSKSTSPFLELFNKFCALIGSLFGLNSGNAPIFNGGGSSPIIPSGKRRK